MIKKIGKQTVIFENPPRVLSSAAIVGDLEGEGPLGRCFDMILNDDTWGEKSWEKAECKMFQSAVHIALNKAHLIPESLDVLLGGDLLNQLISANYAARELKIPFLGLYGACSTMAESTLIGGMLVDGGYANRVACAASSHFCTAERQFRAPLEMGGQAIPTSQRTVTGAGGLILTSNLQDIDNDTHCYKNVCVTGGTIGKVSDLGITDGGNMGAAMAPAAAHTIARHLTESGLSPSHYDAIFSGDLGSLGSEMLIELCGGYGIDIKKQHKDCGNMVFSEAQEVNCGASGCGCSAVVLCGHILKKLEEGEYNRVLFMATGALMSPISSMQGESIPGIAHAVVFERVN